jgi:hypothetical protein
MTDFGATDMPSNQDRTSPHKMSILATRIAALGGRLSDNCSLASSGELAEILNRVPCWLPARGPGLG